MGASPMIGCGKVFQKDVVIVFPYEPDLECSLWDAKKNNTHEDVTWIFPLNPCFFVGQPV
jgi:hypothetical protein